MIKGFKLINGDCLAQLAKIKDQSIDAVITDPPYAEVSREYGRLSEDEWLTLMSGVVHHIRRILKPHGSAVFILQPNSEFLGRMRAWFYEFQLWLCKEWNIVQDAYWWNYCAPPTTHCHRSVGLMKPNVKPCIWAGPPDCYRDQDAVLWQPSKAAIADAAGKRASQLAYSPSGVHANRKRMADTVLERGGASPFNLLPISNSNSRSSGGSYGHPAATPAELCAWWIRYICPPGGTVLDPFAGSAKVGLEAIKLGRRFIGIEKMPKYLEAARERLAQLDASQ